MASISDREYKKRAEGLLQRIRQEVKPFADDTTEGKANRRAKAKADLFYFCKTYLPHYFDGPFESGHEEIKQGLKKKNKIIHIEGFRGLGKTTLACTAYGLSLVLFKITRFLPVICDTKDQAVLLMLTLKSELEENPRLQQDFGDMVGFEWGEDDLVTAGNVRVKAFSWKTFKRGQKHLQWRATRFIGDDWESLESAKNPAQSKKRFKALTGDVINGLDLKKDWQGVVCTNKLGRDDFSSKLEANKEILSIKIPAEQENGRATHPKSFPKRKLTKLKDLVGPVSYAREFLLSIISSEEDDFQEEWFEWIDKPASQYKYIVTAVDPSVGATSGHDTKAIITVGLTLDGKYMDVIHAWIRRTTIHSMCRQVFEVNRTFNPTKVVIESNGFQILLKDKLFDMASAEEMGFQLTGKIKQIINKANKNSRILRLQSPIQNKTMRFVKNGGDMQRLVNQHLDFDSSITTNEDDGPDAEEMAKDELDRMNGKRGNVEVEIIG
ncbi:MAG: hypothetical protein ABJ387_03550 [Balneola sp.]